jgi:hypothetical protein
VATVGLRNGLLLSLAAGIAGQTVVALSLSAEGSYVAHILPGFLLDGIGQGSTWTLMWIAATSGIDAKDRGIASGMASSAQQISVEHWYAKGAVDFCIQMADGRMGYIGTVRDDVPHLLGRPATTIRTWAEENKEAPLAFVTVTA